MIVNKGLANQRAIARGTECRELTLLRGTPVSLGHRGLAGDLLRQEAPGRARVVFDRDRPPLVLPAELGDRESALAANDRTDR